MLPEKKHLFQKYLSKYCTRAYIQIYLEVGRSFEAVPVDFVGQGYGSTGPGIDYRWGPGEEVVEGQSQPQSFSAQIEQLSYRNADLITELDRWKITVLQMENNKHQLEADLEATRAIMERLEDENRRLRESII